MFILTTHWINFEKKPKFTRSTLEHIEKYFFTYIKMFQKILFFFEFRILNVDGFFLRKYTLSSS